MSQAKAAESIAEAAERLVQSFYHAPVSGEVLVGCSANGHQVGGSPAAPVALLVTIRRRVTVHMILEMWLDERGEQEEGMLLVRVNVANGRVGQRVNPLAGEADGLVLVVVQHGVIRIRRELQRVGGKPIFVAPHRSAGTADRNSLPARCHFPMYPVW